MNETVKPAGLKRVYLAAGHSLRAFKWLINNEAAFKQELWLSGILLLISLVFPFTLFEYIALWGALLLVLLTEIINTAIEAVVDRIGLEIHPLSGLAKDLGSLAVLVSLLFATLVWAGLFITLYNR